MEKQEIFNQAIEKEEFEGYNKEALLSIGITIGNNHVTFRDLYTAYSTNKDRYENNPRRGAKIEVEFNRSNDEVLVKQLKTELKFSIEQFLRYLNLLTLCFGEIYPLGSVVELDEKLFTEEYRKISGIKEGERSVLAVITDRFMPVPVSGSSDQHVIEYMATAYPYGDGATMFLNRVVIKGMIHSGLADEKEEAYVQELRENLVMSGRKSIAFLTDEERAGLAKQRKAANERKKLIDGEVS